ncbi:MAG: hypothetical protein ACD_80C00080G0005 [uncultured bacterium (gcode 4)]|uniref:Uncharacterized protein n=1 Tax=uncultured bacterium (gcode 4) TaxID=1234023 RepID=K1XJH3_9BACT|nr:MAG: hypothetical protein ACD_80C00080G0005 [uncultured bacterium (gcode 4)]
MMKHRHTFNTTLGKIVGSLMTIAFSLVAFAHGQNCTWWAWWTINNGQTVSWYSTVLWTTTGQDYSSGCAPFSGALTCLSGIILQNASAYPYTINQCQAGTPKNCINQRLGGPISHWWLPVSAYSTTWAEFPKNCDADFSTTLTCMNGLINGNWQTYKYTASQCIDLNALVPGVDLAINESPGLEWSSNLIAQWSSPQINILFQNKWTDPVIWSINNPWFLSCKRTEQNLNVYNSSTISNFVVNPGTKVGINIRIQPIFTQALGVKTLVCNITPGIAWYPDVNPANNTWSGTFEIVKADRFDLALSTSIAPISKNLNVAEGAKGTQGLLNFITNTLMNVLVPLVIILGILSAILWFYKIMFSSDDSATKDWTNYIIYGVVGIIVIMSAKFIGQNVFDLLSKPELKWFELASWLYNNVIYPFIKIAIYLVLGAMFIILVSRVITFLFGSDDEAQKKAGTLIGWNVISMIVIIWAKQIVEAIYGKQASVVKDITNLWEVGSGILANKNIPIIYQVINYALGIASLVILVIIIIQTVKLLMKPDDEAQIKSIKSSLLYMFIGILVLWAGYLIVNFAIIN